MKLRYVLLLLSMLSLASCATVEGMGEDIESAGEAIQDGADD
ncbi:entericidin, EcnA/B family [Pseudidiomarina salinarum]|nr:entericidin A/B family lipoprotein [Pseudidiomarina salinarum]RUO70564.1 entericidin, EcnA/B family [Pseudidiomarina salinarum]